MVDWDTSTTSTTSTTIGWSRYRADFSSLYPSSTARRHISNDVVKEDIDWQKIIEEDFDNDR